MSKIKDSKNNKIKIIRMEEFKRKYIEELNKIKYEDEINKEYEKAIMIDNDKKYEIYRPLHGTSDYWKLEDEIIKEIHDTTINAMKASYGKESRMLYEYRERLDKLWNDATKLGISGKKIRTVINHAREMHERELELERIDEGFTVKPLEMKGVVSGPTADRFEERAKEDSEWFCDELKKL